MDLDLTDKVAFVAGSSRGIGKAIACQFLAEGGRVVITGRQAEAVTETVELLAAEGDAGRVLGCPGDLLQPEVISEVLAQVHARWGDVDCLVANVGSGTAKPGWDLNESDWQTVFNQNFWASRRLVEAVLPGMVRNQGGSLVFISSIVGVESVNAPLPYSAAKAAVISYGKNLARQVGPHEVRVNCVAPGNILFPGGTWEKKLAGQPDRFQRYIESEVPLKRFGTPEEIAALVVFLSSERAAFITGACVVADGGQTRSY